MNKTVLLCAAIAFAVVGCSRVTPVIDRTPAQNYLKVLATQGVVTNEPAKAIIGAKSICAAIHHGFTPEIVAGQVWQQANGLTEYQAGFVVGSAQKYFCADTIKLGRDA